MPKIHLLIVPNQRWAGFSYAIAAGVPRKPLNSTNTIALSPSAGASARINPEASESYALRASRSGIDRSLPDGDRDAGQARSANQALDDRKPEETEEVRPPASAPVSADGRRQASKFVNRPVSSTGFSSALAHQRVAETLFSKSLLVKRLFVSKVTCFQSIYSFLTLALMRRVRVACSPAGCTTWDSSLTPNRMAWRPYENLIDGELENTTPGKVSGWMRFYRRNQPSLRVLFNLKGDFHEDIRGRLIRFTSPQPSDRNGALDREPHPSDARTYRNVGSVVGRPLQRHGTATLDLRGMRFPTHFGGWANDLQLHCGLCAATLSVCQ